MRRYAEIFILTIMTMSFARTAFGITPFSLPWMNHQDGPSTLYKSSDHPSGIFVIETFYRACGYCNMNEINHINLAKEYLDTPRVQFLDLGKDTNQRDYEIWISNHHPNHPVLKDATRIVIKELGAGMYPSTFIVDCRGNVRYEHEGTWDSTAIIEEIRNNIDKLLEETCP